MVDQCNIQNGHSERTHLSRRSRHHLNTLVPSYQVHRLRLVERALGEQLDILTSMTVNRDAMKKVRL